MIRTIYSLEGTGRILVIIIVENLNIVKVVFH